MTNEEARQWFLKVYSEIKGQGYADENEEAYELAIKALEKVSNLEKICEELAAENDDLHDQLAMRDRFQKQELMREFTEEEAKAYSKALDKMYKPTGFNVFNESCDDAISREMALKECHDIVVEGERYRVIQEETLLGLPPVRPQESCDDAVSRQAVLDIVCGAYEKDEWGESNFYKAINDLPSVRPQEPILEQWQELKETIIELRGNDGTCTQQEVCKFLANYMAVLENQMVKQEPKTGHWINKEFRKEEYVFIGTCSKCGKVSVIDKFCHHCGARMFEPTCDTCKYTTAAFNPCNACKDKSEYEPQESEG